MNPRVRSALLWGVVGAFAFVVLAVGYGLVERPIPMGPGGYLVGAAVVAVAVALVSYAVEYRLTRKGRT